MLGPSVLEILDNLTPMFIIVQNMFQNGQVLLSRPVPLFYIFIYMIEPPLSDLLGGEVFAIISLIKNCF